MKRTYLAGLAAVGLAATACSSGSETEICPAEVGEQVQCLVDLAERLGPSLEPKVSAAIDACASIVTDLGAAVPTYDPSEVAPEDLEAVCQAAAEAIQAATATASASVTLTSGECTVDDGALPACEQSHVDPSCAADCSTQVYLQAECTGSSVSVDPSSTALASTLEDHDPALLDLSAYLQDVVGPVAALAVEASTSVGEALTGSAACESKHREEVNSTAERIGEWTSWIDSLGTATVTVLSSTE